MQPTHCLASPVPLFPSLALLQGLTAVGLTPSPTTHCVLSGKSLNFSNLSFLICRMGMRIATLNHRDVSG